MTYIIYHNLKIKATKEAIFNAFTQPEHLNNWWTLKSSGTPELNEEYNLNFTEKYDWYAKVSEVKPNVLFYLKMTSSDDDWNPTTFGIHLKDSENGTLIEFSHTGWNTSNDEFKNSSFCWAMLLNGLKDYIEKGTIIPFEERS